MNWWWETVYQEGFIKTVVITICLVICISVLLVVSCVIDLMKRYF